MSKIRNIGRYKPQLHAALAAFALMLAASVKEADLYIDVTPAALEKINGDSSAELDHIKLAICRQDKDGNPYQFESPAITSALLKAVSKTNAIAQKAKIKTPAVLFSETGFLYVEGAKFDHKALTIQQLKAQSKQAPAPAPAPAENEGDDEGESEDESEPKAEKKTRKKKAEQA
jgi:hypothetical protein